MNIEENNSIVYRKCKATIVKQHFFLMGGYPDE